MKLFITGSTGYIGSRVTQAAVEKGYEVHALVRNINASFCFGSSGVRYYKGDVRDYKSILLAMKGCDKVIHTAALSQLWSRDRSAFYGINVDGTRNVLEAAAACNISKLVFTSSCAVFGPSDIPIDESHIRSSPFENDYEISKYCAEEMLKEYVVQGLPAVIVCPPRVFGPGPQTIGNPINELIKKILRYRVAFMPEDGAVKGNYAFIDDVVEGHFLALDNGVPGGKYILGGKNVSYKDFFESIQASCRRKIHMVRTPKALLKLWCVVSLASSAIGGYHTHLTPGVINRLCQNRLVFSNKAMRELHYQITPFTSAMMKTIQHLLNS